MQVKLNNETWDVQFTTKKHMPRKTWGLCRNTTKTILVRKDLSTRWMLDTLIHELLHASNFKTFSEEWVEETASEIAKAILKCDCLSVQKKPSLNQDTPTS